MSRAEVFATTHPSLIRRLLTDTTPVRDAAWIEFIRRYEEPIEFCARGMLRRSPSWAPSATDLTSSFFGHLLLGDVFEKWEPSRGPLRAYVQGVLRRFLAGELRRACPLGVSDDEVLVAMAGDAVAVEAELAQRWAYNVFVLALHHVGSSNPDLATLWLELEGLHCLVADRKTWKMASFDEATAAVAARTIQPPATAADIARRLALAEGTVHNRKYRANTLLFGYLAAEIRASDADADVAMEIQRLLAVLEPLIPALAVLRVRAGGGNAESRSSSSDA